jgi:hypothetical protein
MRFATQGDAHPEIGVDLASLADLLRLKGDLTSAAATYREALERQRRTLPAGHPVISRTTRSLGGVLRLQGRAEGAERLPRGAEGSGGST